MNKEKLKKLNADLGAIQEALKNPSYNRMRKTIQAGWPTPKAERLYGNEEAYRG